jgi:hypothetical protein
LYLLLCASAAAFAAPSTAKYKLDLSAELRVFPETAMDSRQADQTLSISAVARADYAWHNGKTQLAVAPFVRLDSADSERSHADLREFEMRHRSGNFDWRGGIGKVFWGTAEFVHLVDVINQTDAVESIDGEDKLGQPMLSLAWRSRLGVFTGFLLPYFRERNLPGTAGRLRAPLRYDTGNAIFESTRGKKHIDAALRWNYSGDAIDIGLSHFVGTGREPRFLVRAATAEPALVPIYDQIRQSSLDVNLVKGGWIWKLEALHQHNPLKDYDAAIGGFEYTLTSNDSGAAIGLLAEYAWDGRGGNSTAAFQNDLFAGLRVSRNDVAGSELLLGLGRDLQFGSHYVSLDASRRIGNDARLVIKLRIIDSNAHNDALSALTQDDHLLVEYTRYY